MTFQSEILPFPQTNAYHHHSETFTLQDGTAVLWQDSRLHILDASMKIRVQYKISHYGHIYESSEGLVVCNSMAFMSSKNHKGSFCILNMKQKKRCRFFLTGNKWDSSPLIVTEVPHKWDYISISHCYATPSSDCILIETDHHTLYSWRFGSSTADLVSTSAPYMSLHGTTSNGQFLFSRSFQNEKGYCHELILRDAQTGCTKMTIDKEGYDIHTWFQLQLIEKVRVIVLSKFKEPCMKFLVQRLRVPSPAVESEFSLECHQVQALDDTRFIIRKIGHFGIYTLDKRNLSPLLLHEEDWSSPFDGALASISFSTRGFVIGSVRTHYKWRRHLSEEQYQIFRLKVPALRGEMEIVCEEISLLPPVLQTMVMNYLEVTLRSRKRKNL
jgi:hypothetical protein